MAKAMHLLIHGRVQGVGFRYTAKTCAEELGVRGWVRNLPDGSVEAHVEGEPALLDAFVAGIRDGSRWASVTRVDREEVPASDLCGFEIRR